MQNSNLALLVVLTRFLLFDLTNATERVCYGKYGCFSNAKPFHSPFLELPQDPSLVNTTFFLFTRSNRDVIQYIDDSDKGKLQKSNFDISKRTIIIVHGWREDALNTGWGKEMRDALLDREDCNLVLTDYSGGAKTMYSQAAGNARLVGVQIAELVKFLISSNAGSPNWADRFYLIGYSLGAQVAGYAGRHLRVNGMELGRITALDPAGTLFSYKHPAVRLDQTDAKYVDVIHTASRFVASHEVVGHIDFFPNGGYDQPGCNKTGTLSSLISTFCDHSMAPLFYIASVKNECSWKAYPCSYYILFKLGLCKECDGECPSMGYAADRTKKTGKHYLGTNAETPFCGDSKNIWALQESWRVFMGVGSS